MTAGPRLVPDLGEELTTALGHVEELLLTFSVREEDDPELALPAPLAGRAALEAVRRLWDAVAPTQGERAALSGNTGRMLAPDGRYEHLPLRLAPVDPADVATLAAAARVLGNPHAGDTVGEALEAGAVIAYGASDEESRRRLAARTAQIAGLLGLAVGPDTEILRALVEAAGPGEDIILTADAEAAYQRQAARYNATWALGSPIDRFLY